MKIYKSLMVFLVSILISLIVAIIMGCLYVLLLHLSGKLVSERRAYFANREGRVKPNSILQVVHLDLKGAPPKMNYLIDLVPRLVSAGVTGLLIEYEDMFPYEGLLKNISSTKPYTKSEISRFLQYCAEQNIEVIPLIQTFGHMEHVLKLNEFQFYREDHQDPRAICPTYVRTKSTIEEMIRQVMDLHKDSKRIHIGCDEVYAVKVCSRCVRKRISKSELFFSHIRKVAKFIQEEFKFKVTPLIWDDMLRAKSIDLIRTSDLPYHIEIVIWDYTAKLEKPIRRQIWEKYAMFFKKIWVAGAYKGADGPKALLPSMLIRNENHKSWMQFIKNKIPTESSALDAASIVGFVSTGWSRYDHFAPLCELLPASIPSLILNSLQASTILGSSRDYIGDYNELLKCKSQKGIMSEFTIKDIYNMSHVNYCTFPESELIFNIWQMEHLQSTINQLYDDLYDKHGRLSEYQVKTNMISIKNIDEQFEAKSFNATYMRFVQVYSVINNELRKYFNEMTVAEWLETHVEPYSKKLNILKNVREAAAKINVWPRRNP